MSPHSMPTANSAEGYFAALRILDVETFAEGTNREPRIGLHYFYLNRGFQFVHQCAAYVSHQAM